MNSLTVLFALAFVVTLVLLVRSLFRQAGAQDAIKQTAEEAKGQLNLWEEFGEHLDEGVALVNPDGTIEYLNQAFADLIGWKGRSARSQQLTTVLNLSNEGKRLEPDERKRKADVTARDGTATKVYAVRRKLQQPTGYEVVLLLDATAEEAEKSLRKRLVNLSSFELRAPITAMKGYADLLLSGDSGKLSKDAQQKVKTILDSSNKLLRIIDDMSKVQSITPEAKAAEPRERVNATALAEKVSPALKKTVEESGRKFALASVHLDAEVQVNSSDIERLLAMVANTAARTGNAGSTVTLRTEDAGREVNFRIENEGSPLGRDQQHNVFDYAGAQGFEEGIGYYVAEQVIGANHARFSMSQSDNGNVFTLSIPKAQAATKPTARKTRTGKKVDIGK